MINRFDMEVFLAGVLTGSYTTQKRHLRQARLIQAAISERWQKEVPWSWQRKHLKWFLRERLKKQSKDTRYYYFLTVKLIAKRLGVS